jgi:hypothetical protein
MKANLRTYKMDNGKYGVFVELKAGKVATIYTDKVEADTELEALQKSIKEGVLVELLNE